MIKNREIIIDHILLILMILLSIFLVYYIPPSLNKILFLIFPILTLFSKKNYLFFAYVIILLDQPGGLFYSGLRDDPLRLPIYPIANLFSISFQQIIILTFLFKALSTKMSYKPFFKNKFILFGILFLFLIFLSFFLGISFQNFKLLARTIVNITIIFSTYFLLKDELEYKKLFYILYPFAFYAILLQLFALINGYQIIHLFRPDIKLIQGIISKGKEGWDRPIELVITLMLCFYSSLFYLLKKDEKKLVYLLTINILSYISLFFTATRSYFLALTSTYIVLFLFLFGPFTKALGKNIIFILLFIFLFFSFDIFKKQFYESLDRIGTVEYLLEGDVTAGGTLKRYNVRAPLVMQAFKESTILFGAAFSKLYFEKADGHVGFHNFLFNTGIVGLFMLLTFLLNYSLKWIKLFKMSINNTYKNSIIIFPLFILSICILNTGTQYLGYDIELNRLILFSIMIYFSNLIYYKLKNINLNFQKQS